MSETQGHNWKYYLNLVGIAIATTYCVVAVAWFSTRPDENDCQKIIIDITDIDDLKFVSEREIRNTIEKTGIPVVGTRITHAKADTIEKIVKAMNMVRRAEAYRTVDGDMRIDIWQRCPVMKVEPIVGESYYIDTEREKMPISNHETTRLIRITGHVKYVKARGELFDFVEYLKGDKFWRNHIDEIRIAQNGQITLIARKGVKFIKLGKLNNYRKRLDNLYAWYEQYPAWAWRDNKYNIINIAYDDLIFCRK